MNMSFQFLRFDCRSNVPLCLLISAIMGAALPATAQRLKLPVPTPELARIARQDSADAAAQYNLGLALLSEHKYDEAEAEFRLAAALDPKLAVAYLTLAYLPFAREKRLWDWYFEENVPAAWKGRVDESERLYRRAIMIDPLVDLRIVGAVLPPRDAGWLASDDLLQIYEQFYQGYSDLYNADYAAAQLRLGRLIKDYKEAGYRTYVPASLRWWHALATAHTGGYAEAAREMRGLLDDALEEQARKSDRISFLPLTANHYRYNLARMLELSGDTATASTLYREAAEADLGLYMAHVRLAAICEGLRQWDAAIAERRRAVQSNPDDPSLLLDLGVTLANAGRLPEAQTALREAIDANPQDPRGHRALALVALARGDIAVARPELERFLQLAPSRLSGARADARRRLEALP